MLTEGLIREIEREREGSARVDWLIAQALEEVPEHEVLVADCSESWYRPGGAYRLEKCIDADCRRLETWRPKPRSASLDAAFAMIPDTHTIQLSQWEHKRLCDVGQWCAILDESFPDKRPSPEEGLAAHEASLYTRCSHAHAPVIAVLVAVLRLRLHQSTNQPQPEEQSE